MIAFGRIRGTMAQGDDVPHRPSERGRSFGRRDDPSQKRVCTTAWMNPPRDRRATATLILNRQPGKRDLWRAYRVMIDRNQVAVLNEGEPRELTLSPGSHEIWIKLDWTRSPKFRLDLAEASRTYLRCRAGDSPWMAPSTDMR